jgi:hypothetical protein
MTFWRFSDGTVIHLGGRVKGESPFAQEMRAAFGRDGLKVHLWPLPSQATLLDKNNLTHMHLTLFEAARQAGVKITKKPDNIPAPPPPPWGKSNEREEDRIVH